MKKNKIKLKQKSFPATIYSLLAGPIELLLIYLIFGTEKTNSLFSLLGFILIYSFLYALLPFLLKLILRIFKIDIFDDFDEETIIAYSPISYLLSWCILFIFVDMGTKTLFGRIFSIIALTMLIGGFNIIGSGIFTLIRHPDAGANLNNEKNSKKNKKDKLDIRYKEYYKDGRYIGDSRTISYGAFSETTFRDNAGNNVGEIDAVEFGKKDK